jgi:hypothetical protein
MIRPDEATLLLTTEVLSVRSIEQHVTKPEVAHANNLPNERSVPPCYTLRTVRKPRLLRRRFHSVAKAAGGCAAIACPFPGFDKDAADITKSRSVRADASVCTNILSYARRKRATDDALRVKAVS